MSMRNPHLDFIRGTAIVLVLLRHSSISNRLTQFGWLGVDLFFVLSGFLIASLLFQEYKKTSTVNIVRFLVRRSLKIIPPFYFFIAASLLINYLARDISFPLNQILVELFYLQSYFPGISFHTWSLAVEEHFYLTVTLLTYPMAKYKLTLEKRNSIFLLAGLLIVCLLLRTVHSYPHRHESVFAFTDSHLRCDGILVGMLLAYLVEFTSFSTWAKHNQPVLWIAAFLLIVPGFLFHGGSFFMNTIGLTTVNLGFGIICALAIVTKPFQLTGNKQPAIYFYQFVCFLGIHSYSIYIWHLMVKDYLGLLQLQGYALFACYFAATITTGVLFSFLIEQPFLRLKERLAIARKTELKGMDQESK